MKFKDRVIVVTGSSGGIGQALVHRFAELGARLVRADIRQATDVPSVLGRFVRTDVSSESEVKALIDDVLAHEGCIDLFMSNAGIYLPMDATASELEWQRIIAVNQMSHVWVARHVVPAMLAAGGGHLAITASGASLLSEIGSVGYTASKYAAFGLAEWLAYAYRDRGVTVSVICPGPVSTPMLADMPYIYAEAITADEAADRIVAGLTADTFLITTHPNVMKLLRQKAANPEAYVEGLARFRNRALNAHR